MKCWKRCPCGVTAAAEGIVRPLPVTVIFIVKIYNIAVVGPSLGGAVGLGLQGLAP
jgi:hypothetical protein